MTAFKICKNITIPLKTIPVLAMSIGNRSYKRLIWKSSCQRHSSSEKTLNILQVFLAAKDLLKMSVSFFFIIT